MEQNDVIIIGAGPAGMTAALYALRARMKVLLLDQGGFGGQALIIDAIDNFPAFPAGSNGFDWVEQMEKQLKELQVSIKLEKVVSLKREALWRVKTDQSEYQAHAVICATGAMPRTLDVPGEKEFIGKGVSYCATCDGPFFKDKNVVVVGGGDTAVKDAYFLTRFAKSVTVVHRRDRLRAEKVLQEKLLNHPKVSFAWNSAVTAVSGAEKVSRITVKNAVAGTEQEIPVDGVFVLIGITPMTEFLQGLAELDDAGFVKTNAFMETSAPGLYAAGDCRQQLLRQIVTACGDGATAAYAAQHYVDEKLGIAYPGRK